MLVASRRGGLLPPNCGNVGKKKSVAVVGCFILPFEHNRNYSGHVSHDRRPEMPQALPSDGDKE
jgi:hypothetical protein